MNKEKLLSNTNIVLHLNKPRSKDYAVRMAEFLSDSLRAPFLYERHKDPCVLVLYCPTEFSSEAELINVLLITEKRVQSTLQYFDRKNSEPKVHAYSIMRGDISEWQSANPLCEEREAFERSFESYLRESKDNDIAKTMSTLRWKLVLGGVREQNPLLYRGMIDSEFRQYCLEAITDCNVAQESETTYMSPQ